MVLLHRLGLLEVVPHLLETCYACMRFTVEWKIVLIADVDTTE